MADLTATLAALRAELDEKLPLDIAAARAREAHHLASNSIRYLLWGPWFSLCDARKNRWREAVLARRERILCALLDLAEAAAVIQRASADAEFDTDTDVAYSRMFEALAAVEAAAKGHE